MIVTCRYTGTSVCSRDLGFDFPRDGVHEKGKKALVNMMSLYCKPFMKIYVAGCDRLVDVTPGLG